MNDLRRPLLLFVVVALIFVVGIPYLGYAWLPERAKEWLNASDTVVGAASAGLAVSLAMGSLAYLSYRVWRRLAKRMFGRDLIDTIVRNWGRRR